VLQASDGGRVYVGRGALELKLRQPSLFLPRQTSESVPLPIGSAPTERISRPEPVEPDGPLAPLDKRVLLAKSTLVGLCLTAFACGIVTTVAVDHHHMHGLEQRLRAVEVAAAATPPPAPPVVAEVAPHAPAAPEPVLVQLPRTSAPEAAAPDKTPDKATAPRLAAARTPRPPTPRAPVVRRHAPAAPETSRAPTTPPAAAAAWVDPFAE
jgi:hypothetical protein